MAQIAMVWVEEGCITCDACEEVAPEVFNVQDDTSFIRAEARLDGGFDTNETTKSTLKGNIGTELFDDIVDAAESCP
ncbi:MAG: ferredoxin, partial [Candidatus Poseidoniaceae archaeon]|nr:ferredoxin [Candidatus Poseidoniaceae archaeon]